MSLPHLVDTNIHLRIAQTDSLQYHVALSAVDSLRTSGVELVVALQNLVEFWAVATRPATARGGLGFSHDRAWRELQQITSLFRVLPDPPEVLGEWMQLLDSVGAMGVQAHEARLAATMLANGITHVLTFNTSDFARYSGIVPVDAASVPAA